MTLQELLELTRAGYTKEEINALTVKPTEPAPEQAQPVEPQAQPATPSAETKTTETKTENKELTEKLDQILKAVQLGNLLNTTNPTPQEETVDDILAAIVNPPAIANRRKS